MSLPSFRALWVTAGVAMGVCRAGATHAQTIVEAAGRGDLAAVQRLLDAGVPVDTTNAQQNTALHRAALGSHHEVAELLLRRGAAVDARQNYGRTPLLLVARETGDVTMARRLLDAGADMNAPDRFGSTPLELAAWRGFEPLVDLLLDRGATVPAEGPRVGLYLQFAVERGMPRLFRLVGGDAVDTATRNETGGSLLHSAAAGGSAEIVAALAGRGLDVNQRDRYGRTPLHYAAENGRAHAVRMLLERGAQPDVRSLAGVSPLNAAEQYAREEAARILMEHGAHRAPVRFPDLRGPYLGQQPPGRTATLFAPDIVSTHTFQHGTVVFSPAGDEAFWSSSVPDAEPGYSYGMILTSRRVDDRWTPPATAPFSRPRQGDDVPTFHPDGSRLFFLSTRDGTGERIWWVERTAGGWSEPRRVEGGPNTMGTHWAFSVASDGSIYFNSADPGGLGRGDLYVSRLSGGVYQPPMNLGAPVNTENEESAPFIAPDGSYLLFMRQMPPDAGWLDIFVSFRNADGTWSPPRGLGPRVNTEAAEICPTVSPDGRWLFFNSSRNGNDDNYWVDAAVIEEARGATPPPRGRRPR
jgi:ankyrin repeat protein